NGNTDHFEEDTARQRRVVGDRMLKNCERGGRAVTLPASIRTRAWRFIMTSQRSLERLEQRYLLNGQAPGWNGTITNPYFPLLVGSEYVYSGTKDGQVELDRVL